ncbi:MAG: dTDP-4-amino-4,6-dideoxygalactose transaminase [Lachnospiraceae bacterium]|nr:dTDP-4-amino-4,6-dideoxygalactose transaminase [Lachnospiraceae bacterium]
MIDFNIPPFTGKEIEYMEQAARGGKICGDGPFTKKCQAWINERFNFPASYLTTSGTAALEMAALLTKVGPGDEVILPSYTFCSTADAFVQRGATLVFVDIRPDTMNLDEKKIEAAITEKTKVIATVDYAGVACEMDTINKIAAKHGLIVVEDAAQGFGSTYKGKPLGNLGDFGCFSFHETKNFSMGEGGALVLPNLDHRDEAEIYREKGTDRSKYFRGQIDKYTWVDYGSSYLPSDLNAAYLWAQLESYDTVYNDRMKTWNTYHAAFKDLEEQHLIERPRIPADCEHNAHMYYIKLRDIEERSAMIRHLREHGILAVFHYIPLHSAPAGLKFGRFDGIDEYTTKESECLLRLPLYYGIGDENRQTVIREVRAFFGL